MKNRIYKIISLVMNTPLEKLTDDSSPDTIEDWDSLRHMNLVLALEEEFKIQFRDVEITEMLNVGLIVMIVQEAQARV